MSDKPLIVDLDGTLIYSDSLLESTMCLLKQHFFLCFLLPFWLLKGKAYLKLRIAEKIDLDPALLPYNQDVLDYVKQAKNAGRSCYLVSGAAKKYADAVANHLGLFDGVMATENENLTGSQKVAKLNERFGEKQFDYMGNHKVDVKVWRHCHKAIVVASSKTLVHTAQKVSVQCQHMPVQAPKVKTYLKALRVHQWVKNGLLFVPMLASHTALTLETLGLLFIGFFCFSLLASSVYLLNDLLDLPSDRQHPSKKKRPFASGALPIIHGLVLAPLLLVAAFSMAWFFTPVYFVVALVAYYILTFLYSFLLKKIVMLDTLVLAMLYTQRIIAGIVLIAVEPSFWLLAFSMFIFLSLALLKRYTELNLMASDDGKVLGRGYHHSDAPMVASLGAASAYIAVLVMALYVDSEDVITLYQQPLLLWLSCPLLLYWISRAWLLAHRGQMHDDPIVFAVKDKQSLFIGLLVLLVFFGAS